MWARSPFSNPTALTTQIDTCGLCSGCGTICQNKQRFLQHRKNHHPNTTNVVFDIAWKSDKSRLQNNVGNDKPSSIIRNERRSSGNEDTRCSKESREQRPVQQSRPEHSNKPKTRLVAAPGGACNKCGKLFAYPGSLDKHVREGTYTPLYYFNDSDVKIQRLVANVWNATCGLKHEIFC